MTTRKAAAASDPPRKAEPQDAPSSDEATTRWSPWLKGAISAAIAFHLTAVFWGPLAFASAGSPLTDSVFAVLRPYIDGLYLNHGYSFFAPDVGPSRLVDYKVDFGDGRPPITGRFPDLTKERPRLLYHRHFMLSEALSNRFVPPEPPPEPTPPPLTASANDRAQYKIQREYYDLELARWRHERRQYEAMWNSFTKHLKHEFGGSKVTLTRVEHRLALPDEVRLLKQRLDAPETYVPLPEAVQPEPVDAQGLPPEPRR